MDDLLVPSTYTELVWVGIGPVLGQAVRANIHTGPKSKISVFMKKCVNFVGPFDPFRRPAPGRPPGSKHLWGLSLGRYRSRPWASGRGEYPNGSIIKNISFMMKCTNFVGPFDPYRRPAPKRPPGSNHLWRPRFGWYRSRHGQAVGAKIQTGPTSKISVWWWNAPNSLIHLTHSDGLPQDDLLVPSTYGNLDWVGIGPVLGQAVGANIQTGQTSKISVLWRNAPTLLVHWTHSDGLPQDDFLVQSAHGHLDWVGIGPFLGQAVGANIQTGPTSKISVLWRNAPFWWSIWPIQTACPRTTSWFQAPMGT